jgi:hypothetical protein
VKYLPYLFFLASHSNEQKYDGYFLNTKREKVKNLKGIFKRKNLFADGPRMEKFLSYRI